MNPNYESDDSSEEEETYYDQYGHQFETNLNDAVIPPKNRFSQSYPGVSQAMNQNYGQPMAYHTNQIPNTYSSVNYQFEGQNQFFENPNEIRSVPLGSLLVDQSRAVNKPVQSPKLMRRVHHLSHQTTPYQRNPLQFGTESVLGTEDYAVSAQSHGYGYQTQDFDEEMDDNKEENFSPLSQPNGYESYLLDGIEEPLEDELSEEVPLELEEELLGEESQSPLFSTSPTLSNHFRANRFSDVFNSRLQQSINDLAQEDETASLSGSIPSSPPLSFDSNDFDFSEDSELDVDQQPIPPITESETDWSQSIPDVKDSEEEVSEDESQRSPSLRSKLSLTSFKEKNSVKRQSKESKQSKASNDSKESKASSREFAEVFETDSSDSSQTESSAQNKKFGDEEHEIFSTSSDCSVISVYSAADSEELLREIAKKAEEKDQSVEEKTKQKEIDFKSSWKSFANKE